MARFERIFFAIGFALFAVWGTATLERIVFSRAAIVKFDASKATKAGSSIPVLGGPASVSEVNFGLWPLRRVQKGG